MNCIMHLKDIQGEHEFMDRAPIKAAGLNGFWQTIWPVETVKFDLFGYDVGKKNIFMHTECDVTTPEGCRKPLISKPGTYFLIYEVDAEKGSFFYLLIAGLDFCVLGDMLQCYIRYRSEKQ